MSDNNQSTENQVPDAANEELDTILKSGGVVSGENGHVIEYSLKLDSNPEFTASVLVAYARAVCRMNKEGMTGCKTVFDVPPAYLSVMSGEELRKKLL